MTDQEYPNPNETPLDRQEKISHLINIILASCSTLSEWETNFVNDQLRNLNRYNGQEPSRALTEPQARRLRHIIYKRYNDYSYAVPPLPEGIDFKWEVRRLLKAQN